jgi:hypothetical protein
MSKKTVLTIIAVLLLTLAPIQNVFGFPIGISIHGGLGKGYYSMEELNDNLNELRLDLDSNLSDLSNGTNVMLHGRLWFLGRIAVTFGYEHFWGESEILTTEAPILIKAPANVYSIGGIVTPLSIPVFADFNIGASMSFISCIYGTNQEFSRILEEFKGNDTGYQIYAEAMTNFLTPLQFGLMLGYRGLKIQEFEDRYGDLGFFEPSGAVMEIDYSGVFFYLTAGVGF